MPLPLAPRAREDLEAVRGLSVWRQVPVTTGATGVSLTSARSRAAAPLPTIALPAMPTLTAGPRYKSATGRTTDAVYSESYAPAEGAPEWSVYNQRCCGMRATVAVWAFHCAAAALHLVLFIVTLAFSAGVDDPYLTLWRQRFIFTRSNTSACGPNSFQEDDENRIVAVLEPSGSKVHVAWASACFFLLSFAFHSIWVIGGLYDPVGRILFAMLDSAFVPTRWIEYSASASLMFFVLMCISGARNETDLSSGFVLMATTMLLGLLTEARGVVRHALEMHRRAASATGEFAA